MFKPVDSRINFPHMEERILQLWREHDIFRKSVEQRAGAPLFRLYEGPPTANASPAIHHVLGRVFKDVIPRYKTMKGFQAPRKGGWDTHGLPVELEIERELGLSSKPEIEAYGVARFNQRCRESVMRYVKEWESLTDRIGFWIDMEDAYITFTNDYIESCWWIIKQLWDKGLVYQGYKTTPHCPRCATSLSSHEVAQGYKEDTPDPSIYIKFRLISFATQPFTSHRVSETLFENGVPSYVLAWTTTPWTLPGNTALAVAPEAEYAVVERNVPRGRERLVLARSLLEQALQGDTYNIVALVPGKELVGLSYEPLYDPVALGFDIRRFEAEGQGSSAATLRSYQPQPDERFTYPIIATDFVSLEDGTGVVHIAPAFGEADFEAGQSQGLFFLQPVDLRGRMAQCPTPFSDLFVKDADPIIIRDLTERGLMERSGTIRHTYPFCWRCDSPLLYYVKTSWYIRTTQVKDQLLTGNEEIAWYPEHIKQGRFGDWLANNVDWALSRERYWGTPLPVWRCQGCGQHECVGSVAELQGQPEVAGLEGELDLHRPFIDGVTFRCQRCGDTMRRVPEVLDVWFDSGAMPVAQWHFPFDNQALFQQSYPADYICEAVDQTRGWFYTLHAVATLLRYARPDLFSSGISYRNVICHGHLMDSKGEKMSKSRGNVVEPWEVLNLHGADALRWYLYTASPAGNPRRFSADLVGEGLRKFLLTLWNTYSFFVIYANIDGFDPRTAPAPQDRADLDRWIISELHRLVQEVTQELEGYNPTDAGRRIQEFVDDLSNWYVRRSRRRFWKSGVLSGPKGENHADKLAAYHTLYHCLVTLAKLLAPFTPFVADELYQNLVRSVDPAAPESVHLTDYPVADPSQVDQELGADVRLVMRIASMARAARSKAGIKVRQPLARMLVKPRSDLEQGRLARLAPQLLEEVNVRELAFLEDEAEVLGKEGFAAAQEAGYTVALATAITPELADEGLARELVHRLQTLRRAAGFDIADRITTSYQGDEALRRVMAAHGDYIRQETLSEALVEGPAPSGAHAETQRLDGHPVTLAVQRRG